MDATDLAFAGPAGQAALVRAGDVSARELVELSLRRIERLDPQLNAFRTVLADRALADADAADARHAAGDERPLLGVPVAVKDDQGVAGEVRTVGTDANEGAEPADFAVVARLRAAGAIVVGITTVPELTMWGFTESATNGVTRNPWDLRRTPGGSSGGSGAAVAAGLVATATASDGLGSIRIPAACCGLVGLKPQRGRVPTAPLDAPWHGLAVFGALTRTVADTALVAGVLADRPYVAAAARAPGRLRVALSFAVARESRAQVAPEVRQASEDVAETQRGLGHAVIERDPDLGTAGLAASARYLGGIRDDVAALPHPERLEPRTRTMARLGRLAGDRALRWARASEPAHAARVNAIFADVDVVLTPTLAGPPIPVGSATGRGALRTLDAQARWAPPFTAVWNHVGNPAISLPAGWTPDGLPLAVQLVGPPDGEERLLALASQLEAARPWAERRPGLAA
jgi:amidase